MVGIIMAFKDYRIENGFSSLFTSKWVGFKFFIEFFTDYGFGKLLRNTVAISLLKLVFSFPVPIIFAIMLNEVKVLPFKRIVQTSSYLPHFISWVIIAGISFTFLSSNGIINTLLKPIFKQPVPFLTNPDNFWGLAVFTDIWKDMGWWAIIFLAAITGINPDLFEAAELDGVSRIGKIWYITLPCIRGTIVVVLILALGNLFGGGLSGSNFEQSYLLGNSLNKETSDIIQTYVMKVGLQQMRFSYATAAGLVQSVISLILTFGSNYLAKKFTGSGLF